MKLFVWLGFGLLALLWTGGAALVAGLTEWAAQVLASGVQQIDGQAAVSAAIGLGYLGRLGAGLGVRVRLASRT